MRVTCPQCGAIYEVPDAGLEGRGLRCGRCGHGWTPVAAVPPEQEETAQAPPDLVPMEPPDQAPAQAVQPDLPRARLVQATERPDPVAGWALGVGWLASVAIVAAGVVEMVAHHRAIAQAWPPTQRLFGLFGLGS